MKDSIISKKVKNKDISIKFVTCECPFGYCGETIRSTAFAVKSLVNGKREVDVITLNSFNAKFGTNLHRNDIDKLHNNYPEIVLEFSETDKNKPCIICKPSTNTKPQIYTTVAEALTSLLFNLNKKPTLNI